MSGVARRVQREFPRPNLNRDGTNGYTQSLNWKSACTAIIQQSRLSATACQEAEALAKLSRFHTTPQTFAPRLDQNAITIIITSIYHASDYCVTRLQTRCTRKFASESRYYHLPTRRHRFVIITTSQLPSNIIHHAQFYDKLNILLGLTSIMHFRLTTNFY